MVVALEVRKSTNTKGYYSILVSESIMNLLQKFAVIKVRRILRKENWKLHPFHQSWSIPSVFRAPESPGQTHLKHLVIRPIRSPFRVRNIDDPLQVFTKLHRPSASIILLFMGIVQSEMYCRNNYRQQQSRQTEPRNREKWTSKRARLKFDS